MTINITKGETLTVEITVTKQSDGLPFNLTGYKAYFTVAERLCPDITLIEKTSDTATEIDFTDAAGGIMEVYLTPADTNGVTPREYSYDLWLELELPPNDRRNVIRPSPFNVLGSIKVFS